VAATPAGAYGYAPMPAAGSSYGPRPTTTVITPSQPADLPISAGELPAVGAEESSVEPAPAAEVTPAAASASGIHRVNDKHLQISYEVRDVGPSGLAGVEVWYTRDGQGWKKFDNNVLREQPFFVTVPEEGMYGFRLVPRTGFGGGKHAPAQGDAAHVWVDVDITKPLVFLTKVQPGDGTRSLTIAWTASDKNFSKLPVSLSYCPETSKDVWTPIAANLDARGNYVWKIPSGTPNVFRVRVHATDLAGNVGIAETPEPIQVDLAQPEAYNVRISANNSGPVTASPTSAASSADTLPPPPAANNLSTINRK
jgi:hypothetical protein